jgi:cupin fold WbuC family metalloprotein
MKSVTGADLAALSGEARGAARRRTHLNVHAALDEPVQRLFIAFEPGTYIRPHRHPQANKWELVVLISGSIDLLTLDDTGRVIERVRLAASGTRAAEIPPSTWHSYVCRETGTVLLEVKEGPYVPTTAENFAPWSPAEGDSEALPFLERLGEAQPGQVV